MEKQTEVGILHECLPNEVGKDETSAGVVHAESRNETEIRNDVDNLQVVDTLLKHGSRTQQRDPIRPGDLYKARDIQILFRISRRTVSNWQYSGILKPKKIGRVVYYLRQDIEALMTSARDLENELDCHTEEVIK